MKKTYVFCLLILLCFALCACQKQNTDNPAATTNADLQAENTDTLATEQAKTFPFEDAEGLTRYRLVINDEEILTENYPFTKPDDSKSGYYPLKDVLTHLGVECLCSDDAKVLTAKINGNVIKVAADAAEMIYGKSTLKAQSEGIMPVVINDVLYVPSFFLMKLSDNSIVDFSNDGTAATLSTDVVIDSASSGTDGLSLPSSTSNNASNNSGGSQLCSKCGGAGGHNESYFEQVLVNGQWKQIAKSRWITCPQCGGSGQE